MICVRCPFIYYAFMTKFVKNISGLDRWSSFILFSHTCRGTPISVFVQKKSSLYVCWVFAANIYHTMVLLQMMERETAQKYDQSCFSIRKTSFLQVVFFSIFFLSKLTEDKIKQSKYFQISDQTAVLFFEIKKPYFWQFFLKI